VCAHAIAIYQLGRAVLISSFRARQEARLTTLKGDYHVDFYLSVHG
jgi:hypothetical protein